MTRYTVVWHAVAEGDLARIWTMAIDRQAVANAADTIDRELSRDPSQKGHEFHGKRLFVSLPLEVTFSVSEADRTVRILQVWCQY